MLMKLTIDDSDGRFGEGHPEVAGLTELVVMQLDQGNDSVINRSQLNKCHLPVLGKELKCDDIQTFSFKCLFQVLFFNRGRDVREMKGGRWRVNV